MVLSCLGAASPKPTAPEREQGPLGGHHCSGCLHLPPCLPHAWAPSQLAAWLTPHPLPLAPFSLPLPASLKTGLG